MNRVVFIIILSFFSIASYPQVFKGITSFKEAIEWEGQRYLMDEIYNISSESIDTLRIEKILRDVDSNTGFMIVVTSYTFNQKTGVVLTSFNSISFDNSKQIFRNVHLDSDEFNQLNKTILLLRSKSPYGDKHLISRFNNRIILDVKQPADRIYEYIIWIDNYCRHSFTESNWERAMKKHEKFINED